MVLGLVLLVGGSYAFYTYQKYSGMQNLLNGEIYLNYLEDNEVHISGIFPETKEEALKRNDNTISFKVLSKNTSDKDIYYGITLNYGEEISNKIRIDAKYIMIYLECDGKVLIDGIRYSDFNNRRIYVDKIDAKTYTETTKNYTLRFWVDEETTISDTDTNASYKATEWANSYLNFKVNVDAGLETMNMPLSMETSDTYVENNKAYFIAKISNYVNAEDAGLASNDKMNLKVTGTNSDIKFSYKDSEGNTVEERSDTLDLTYLFTKNKTVEIQVFVHPNNDANGKTNVLLEIYKNKELMQSFIKRVEVKGNNYCLNNGFNKLADCMLVSDSLSESVDIAKTNISNKGEPNLNDTSPTYTYVEQLTEDVKNVYSVANIKFNFSKTYEFDSNTGTFKLTGDIVGDYLSDDYIGYWTSGHTGVGINNLNAIYYVKETSVNGGEYKITKGDKLTYKIASSIRSEVGLYKTEDDYGDVYYYRGDVQNNNVYFGGYYWKIIRTNGDGSIRMRYYGSDVSNSLSINNRNYTYNNYMYDPTFAGYMYGKNFQEQTSDLTDFYNIARLNKYYFATSYTFDEKEEMYSLAGDIISSTYADMENFDEYKYSCFSNSSVKQCKVIVKINSYNTSTNGAKVQYISYTSTNLKDTKTNEYDSNIKTIIDSWYYSNIVSKKDSDGNPYSSYISDGSFCNDRNTSNIGENDKFLLNKYLFYNHYVTSNVVSLKCQDIRDKFSATSEYGNGNLTYPVALLTVDEVKLAGGKYNTKNSDFYLYSKGTQWTMTPTRFHATTAMQHMFIISYNGLLNDYRASNSGEVHPVINIKKDILISQGDGTTENPYILKLQ